MQAGEEEEFVAYPHRDLSTPPRMRASERRTERRPHHHRPRCPLVLISFGVRHLEAESRQTFHPYMRVATEGYSPGSEGRIPQFGYLF